MYLSETDDANCIAALLRFSERLDLEEVLALIDEMPDKAFGLDVMGEEQRAFTRVCCRRLIGRACCPPSGSTPRHVGLPDLATYGRHIL